MRQPIMSKRFRHRVDFDADVAGAGMARKLLRLAVVAEDAVGGVLDDDDVVLLGEGDCSFVELGRGGAAGGAVGVAEDEQLGFARMSAGMPSRSGRKSFSAVSGSL